MLKFIKGNLENIDNVQIYPMISLLIFFVFFVVLFYWVVTAKKKYINEVSNIPLDLPANSAGLPADSAGLPADSAGLPADSAGDDTNHQNEEIL